MKQLLTATKSEHTPNAIPNDFKAGQKKSAIRAAGTKVADERRKCVCSSSADCVCDFAANLALQIVKSAATTLPVKSVTLASLW